MRGDHQLPNPGTDLDTRDGTAVLDNIRVTDVADADLKVLDHLAAGGALDDTIVGNASRWHAGGGSHA